MYRRSVFAVITGRSLDDSVCLRGSNVSLWFLLCVVGMGVAYSCVRGGVVMCIRNPQTQPKTGPMRLQFSVRWFQQ